MNMTQLKYYDDVERLEFILEHPDIVNRYSATHRPYPLTYSLVRAAERLPEGKYKRALYYLATHECAEFHFGGKDVVGSALREAIKLFQKAA